MYALMGAHPGGQELIALFTTEEKAQEYIEKTKLTKAHSFHKKSLLSFCNVAWVEKYYGPGVPVDPEI